MYASAPPFEIPGLHIYACEYNPDTLDRSTIPASLQNAVPKRQVEFLMGRHAAHKALAMMGISAAVGRNPDRSPSWPPATLGSITHTHHFSMAAVGLQTSWQAIGIDSEFISSTKEIESFSSQFISQSELNLGISFGFAPIPWLYTLFSAKESIFKSLYPQVQSYFGFFDVALTSITTTTLTFKLAKSLPPYPLHFPLTCSYRLIPPYTHTLIAF